MDELERLLEQYIQSEGSAGRIIAVKAMRNIAATIVVEKGVPVSDVLRGVADFVKLKVNDGKLFRQSSGVYSYLPKGVPSELRSSDRQGEVVSLARSPGVDALDNLPSAFSAFESVASLASSDQFLIKRDIKQVDLQALQGFSL